MATMFLLLTENVEVPEMEYVLYFRKRVDRRNFAPAGLC